jgi:hypothetical protein
MNYAPPGAADVMLSISARSSAVNFHPPAATFAAICPGFVAPAITLDTGSGPGAS